MRKCILFCSRKLKSLTYPLSGVPSTHTSSIHIKMQHLPDDLCLELRSSVAARCILVRFKWRQWKHIGRNQKEPEFTWNSIDGDEEVGNHYRLFGYYKKHCGAKVGFEHLFVAEGFCHHESLASCCARLSKEELGRVGMLVNASAAPAASAAEPALEDEVLPAPAYPSAELVDAAGLPLPLQVAAEAVPESTPCICTYPNLALLPTTLRVRYAFPGVAGWGRLYRTAENELLLHRWDIEPLSLLRQRHSNILELLFVNDVSLKTILETYTERQIRELDVYVLGASLPERLSSLKDSLVHKKEMLRQLEEIAALQAEHDRVDTAIRALQRA